MALLGYQTNPLQSPPLQQSQEEIRALEADAAFTVQGAITTAVLLYLSPFAINLVGKIF
ncbi:uncharacterized protein FFUJ_04411 [Fusarium fujikuroi IMI 58289]|uniref:Mitochondrial outer membrane translocase complex, subunit Tom5 n=1 Tax=Gibberella fujikuroi (strain CBS 195.34 / IMI 58289 / NRRL A-6831) TaxID=1279085 RepID=S0DRN1_GIBF5|nr:uncharacterized protein FFUJ_04411 [Fusarium fujikuroi IMI 58289]CCT65095.1 uncharacterized protein FFUJ_04411 [Fusarium fujikuroi IMI 58289]